MKAYRGLPLTHNRVRTATKPILFLVFLLSLFVYLIPSNAVAAASDNFITVWNTENNGDSITFPGEGNYTIDWGDDSALESATGTVTHGYDTASTHIITVSNAITRFNLNFGTSASRLRDVSQWGTARWTSMKSAFTGARNMRRMSATDKPNLSLVTDMSKMFQTASLFNGDISGWNVAKVTNMSQMFYLAKAFNQDISGWNVANVTNMFYMFNFAKAFNQDIGRWNVAKVTNMSQMFRFANAFNQDISGWNVAAVTNMVDMFEFADRFNQNLGRWYIVPNNTNSYNGSSNLAILTLSAQNDVLSGHNPVYALATGNGDADNTRFTLTSGTLSVKATTAIESGVYSVRIGASGTDFGDNNAVTLTITVSNVTGTVTITSIVKTVPLFTLDVDKSGVFDINDALMIARYALSIKGANLTASLTGATPTFVVTNIEAGESSSALDVDEKGGFDINDALMIVRYALSIKGANLTASLTDANPTVVVRRIEGLIPPELKP